MQPSKETVCSVLNQRCDPSPGISSQHGPSGSAWGERVSSAPEFPRQAGGLSSRASPMPFELTTSSPKTTLQKTGVNP